MLPTLKKISLNDFVVSYIRGDFFSSFFFLSIFLLSFGLYFVLHLLIKMIINFRPRRIVSLLVAFYLLVSLPARAVPPREPMGADSL